MKEKKPFLEVIKRYSVFITTPDGNRYQIQPTQSLTQLVDDTKKLLRLLVQSGELTRDQSRDKYMEIKELANSARQVTIDQERSGNVTSTTAYRTKRMYTRRSQPKTTT